MEEDIKHRNIFKLPIKGNYLGKSKYNFFNISFLTSTKLTTKGVIFTVKFRLAVSKLRALTKVKTK